MATPTDEAIPQIPGVGANVQPSTNTLLTFKAGDPQGRLISYSDLRTALSDVPPGIDYITQDVVVADFTDATATTGTLVMDDAIPAGAIILGSKCLVTAGFAGDTSATLQIGDGSDADRYSTGTPSVFATAATGIQMGIPSGTKYVVTANTPTLTVTTAANFTDCQTDDSGAMTVAIFYIRTI